MFFKVLAVALWFVSVYFTKLMLEDGFGVSSTNFISLSVAVVLQAVLSAVEIMMLNHQRFGKMDAHRQSMYSAFFVFVVFVDFLSNQRGIAAWLSQPVAEEPVVVRITKLLEFFLSFDCAG
ncbi:hypothetical protein HC928_24200 [bacterium]|nr:hypothetical protein [bacterium]